jgi:hypothetical protein
MAISRRPPRKAIGLAAHDQASPRRRKAELGLEEHRAEREAEDQQRRGRRLSVDQNERDEHGERQRRRSQERPVETRRRRRGGGWSCSDAHAISQQSCVAV